MAETWKHTAELLAKIHNVNTTEQKDRRTSADFNLYELSKKSAPKSGRKLTWKEKVGGLKSRIVEE
jgi:hypothetical protein